VKDGAHTHGSGSGGTGLGIAVAVGAGAVLAARIGAAAARVLPVLVTGAAVIAGLCIAGWVARAVIWYRCEQAAIWRHDADAAARRDQLGAAARLADPDAAARPGLARPEHHEHLHFHGLAAGQVAAVLAARRHSGGDQ
jgi:hypothetical protein